MNSTSDEINLARRWLREHCHRCDVRHVLERGIEYVDAVSRAGLCTDTTAGDDLYSFLTDPGAAAARTHSFVEPTL